MSSWMEKPPTALQLAERRRERALYGMLQRDRDALRERVFGDVPLPPAHPVAGSHKAHGHPAPAGGSLL